MIVIDNDIQVSVTDVEQVAIDVHLLQHRPPAPVPTKDLLGGVAPACSSIIVSPTLLRDSHP
jgi:hypothetical protein